MCSFLLNCRLRLLSRSITKYTFSKSREKHTRDDLFQARLLLYSDMLQYLEDHPDASYETIYHHFVDQETEADLSQQTFQHAVIGIIFTCIAIILIGFLILDPILQIFLKNTPISYSNIQHFF